MRKVLIIAYYWPPAGGGGVLRWVKFAKYLPEFGWEPIVYVPYNPQYPLTDHSLLSQVPEDMKVIKGHIWEARRFYRGLKRLRHGLGWSSAPEMDTLFFREKKQLSWFGRFSLFLRSNLFVPDSRSLWIKPSCRRLRKWLAAHPVDAIVSTGPPHSCHLIGLKLKQSTGLPWIADFRDPWLEIDYFPQLSLTKRTLARHERMQHDVLTNADKILTVSQSWANLFRSYGAQNVQVITNGFDQADFDGLPKTEVDKDKFIIASIGTLEMDRNPLALWSALSTLLHKQPGLRDQIEVRLAGKIDTAIMQDTVDVTDLIRNYGYLPHQEGLALMQHADILLLLLNQIDSANTRGRIPGKLFEYLAIGKPILMLGAHDSDSCRIISELGNSWCVNYNDDKKVLEILESALSDKQHHKPTPHIDLARFERRNLTHALADALNGVIPRKT